MKTTQEKQNTVERPDWFRAEPGFKWFDTDGDLCVYLGTAGFRAIETLTLKGTDSAGREHIENRETLVFKPIDSEVYAYHYKNEWHLSNLRTAEQESTWNWRECKPAENVDKCVRCNYFYSASNGGTFVEAGTAKMSFKCNWCSSY